MHCLRTRVLAAGHGEKGRGAGGVAVAWVVGGRDCPPTQGQVSPVPRQRLATSIHHILRHHRAHHADHLSGGAARAAPDPSPARGWTGLLGGRATNRIKGASSPCGSFVSGDCLPESSILGPQTQDLQPVSLEQRDRQLPLSFSEKCGNKKAGWDESLLPYLLRKLASISEYVEKQYSIILFKKKWI